MIKINYRIFSDGPDHKNKYVVANIIPQNNDYQSFRFYIVIYYNIDQLLSIFKLSYEQVIAKLDNNENIEIKIYRTLSEESNVLYNFISRISVEAHDQLYILIFNILYKCLLISIINSGQFTLHLESKEIRNYNDSEFNDLESIISRDTEINKILRKHVLSSFTIKYEDISSLIASLKEL